MAGHDTHEDEDKGDRGVSREEAEECAADSPVLAGMISRRLPLTPNDYQILAGLGDRDPDSDDWGAEDELSVAECFRDPDAVKADPGRKGSDHRPLLD
jgi:hypothetical protein